MIRGTFSPFTSSSPLKKISHHPILGGGRFHNTYLHTTHTYIQSCCCQFIDYKTIIFVQELSLFLSSTACSYCVCALQDAALLTSLLSWLLESILNHFFFIFQSFRLNELYTHFLFRCPPPPSSISRRNWVKLCYVSHVYVPSPTFLSFSLYSFYLSLSLSLIGFLLFIHPPPASCRVIFLWFFKMQFQFVSRSILLHKEKAKNNTIVSVSVVKPLPTCACAAGRQKRKTKRI